MAKGAGFEREFCQRLSLWASGGEHSDWFWRTSNSGGRATVRGKAGKGTSGQYGDVCATDPRGRFVLKALSFELKRGYGRATPHDLLDVPPRAKEQAYAEWVRKARRDAAAAKSKSFAVVHRRDRRRAVIFLTAPVAKQLLRPKPPVWCAVAAGEDVLVGVRLDDFFAAVEPAALRGLKC